MRRWPLSLRLPILSLFLLALPSCSTSGSPGSGQAATTSPLAHADAGGPQRHQVAKLASGPQLADPASAASVVAANSMLKRVDSALAKARVCSKRFDAVKSFRGKDALSRQEDDASRARMLASWAVRIEALSRASDSLQKGQAVNSEWFEKLEREVESDCRGTALLEGFGKLMDKLNARKPDVRILKWRASCNSNPCKIWGTLKNVSGRELRGVLVKGHFKAFDKMFTAEAVAPKRPIPPNESTPFKVLIRREGLLHHAWNAELPYTSNCEFHELAGERLFATR